MLVAVVMARIATPVARVVDAQGRPTADLRGELLVATDDLRDPRLLHTGIYTVRHDAGQALSRDFTGVAVVR